MIRVDQDTEFASRDLDLWAYARGVTLDFSRPGKPTDNAYAEAFNSRVRAECMNAHWAGNSTLHCSNVRVRSTTPGRAQPGDPRMGSSSPSTNPSC